MSPAPRVSVIIPTYNRSEVLRHAIASALAQTFADFELLVVGDCCTDDSAEVVARFADSRIRWTNLPVNSGHQSTPNNEGLRLAEGELIAYLGHDDLWFRHHLETLVAAIDAGADIVSGMTEMVGPDESRLDIAPPGTTFNPGLWLPPTGLMHRRSASERIGGWRDYRQTEFDPENDLCERAIAAGACFVVLSRLTAVKFPAAWRKDAYRLNDDSEQVAWLARIASEPDIERHEMARLILAGKRGQLPVMHAYRKLWIELLRQSLRWPGARARSLRLRLGAKGARIDAARRHKGLGPRP